CNLAKDKYKFCEEKRYVQTDKLFSSDISKNITHIDYTDYITKNNSFDDQINKLNNQRSSKYIYLNDSSGYRDVPDYTYVSSSLAGEYNIIYEYATYYVRDPNYMCNCIICYC